MMMMMVDGFDYVCRGKREPCVHPIGLFGLFGLAKKKECPVEEDPNATLKTTR